MTNDNTASPASQAEIQLTDIEEWKAAITMIHGLDIETIEDGDYYVFAFCKDTQNKAGFFNKQRSVGFVEPKES